MIGITIISYDTKNIYVRTWPGQQDMDTPFFLPCCTLEVEGKDAVWNWTDVLHMFGLHFRWLVARLRQAPPELSSKHAMQTHRFKQVKQANSLRSTNMLTEVVKRAYIIYATEWMPQHTSKSPSRDNHFHQSIYDQSLRSNSISFSLSIGGADMAFISNVRKFLSQRILGRHYFGHLPNNFSTKPVDVRWKCKRPSDSKFPGQAQFIENSVTAVARMFLKDIAIIRYVGTLHADDCWSEAGATGWSSTQERATPDNKSQWKMDQISKSHNSKLLHLWAK